MVVFDLPSRIFKNSEFFKEHVSRNVKAELKRSDQMGSELRSDLAAWCSDLFDLKQLEKLKKKLKNVLDAAIPKSEALKIRSALIGNVIEWKKQTMRAFITRVENVESTDDYWKNQDVQSVMPTLPRASSPSWDFFKALGRFFC